MHEASRPMRCQPGILGCVALFLIVPLAGSRRAKLALGVAGRRAVGRGAPGEVFQAAHSGFPLLIGHLSFKQVSWVHASGEAGRALASEIGLGDRRGRFAPYYAQSPQKTSCDLWAGGE